VCGTTRETSCRGVCCARFVRFFFLSAALLSAGLLSLRLAEQRNVALRAATLLCTLPVRYCCTVAGVLWAAGCAAWPPAASSALGGGCGCGWRCAGSARSSGNKSKLDTAPRATVSTSLTRTFCFRCALRLAASRGSCHRPQ
jgi:hypothetical protein